ncbi:MAG: helix-turn-helix domain-containing protein [Candidatus Azobacteroides sp.]|nr:helix-turn-helix domain-containing protein [Candidatus Azobacteroides sp.]
MKLREILKRKNINQSVVADALGINVNNIRRYDDLEKRSLEEIIIIADAIGVSMSELICMVTKDAVYKLDSTENKASESENQAHIHEILKNIDKFDDITEEKKEYVIMQMIYNMTKALLVNAENGKIANRNVEVLIEKLLKIKNH